MGDTGQDSMPEQAPGEVTMILLADEIETWGYSSTVHYTHAPRSVVMQIYLAGRMDFTEIDRQQRIVRANALFTKIIARGIETDLLTLPHIMANVRARDLT